MPTPRRICSRCGPRGSRDPSLRPEAKLIDEGNYYPVNRAVLDVPVRIRKKHAFERFEAYDQALEAGGRNFRVFFEWFRQREDIENEQNARSKRRRYVDRQLQAVRSAVERLMPGFSELHVERNPQRMVVSKKGESLAVDQLSDGEKCVLAMVGDLARRLAIVSLEGAEPLDEHAVVLIDEIDLHLHPAWERAVLPSLRRAFPNCQIIVSTHSPHVIATAPRESVIILEDFQAYAPPTPTKGRNVGAILKDVLGVGRALRPADRPYRRRTAEAPVEQPARRLSGRPRQPTENAALRHAEG